MNLLALPDNIPMPALVATLRDLGLAVRYPAKRILVGSLSDAPATVLDLAAVEATADELEAMAADLRAARGVAVRP